MKQFLYPVLASALVAVAATSCSSDAPVAPEQTPDGTVAFTVAVPQQIASRAFSDGLTATQLHYYVYDEDESSANIAALNGTATFTDLKTTVNLSLVSGKSYSVVFWADVPSGSPYTYDTDSKEITVSYDGEAQDENRDAFFAYRGTFRVTGPMSETITLKRPFSQINIGTSDYAAAVAAGLTVENTEVTVKGVYEKFNLATGDVVGDAVDATFTSAAIPSISEVFPYEPDTYKYMAMNYVLVGNEKITVDVDFSAPGTMYAGATFAAVPVQRNYRTNIFGALLTDPAEFNVIINPDYETPDYDIEIVKVATPDAFVEAIEAGMNVLVPVEANVDLIGKGEIALANEQIVKVEGTLNTERAQISVSGAGNVAYVEGPGKITSIGVAGATGNRPLNAYDGATLVVRNLELETEQNNGGSVIFSQDGNLDLEGVTINCHNFAVGADGGTLKAKDCIINSDSNNREGAFSYTLSVATGCQAVLEDVQLTGIQGGVTVQGEGAVCTIKSGTYKTVAHPQYGENVAFYPVYATDNGVAIIEGGDFTGVKNWSGGVMTEGTSALVAGDNDVNMPDGNFIIKGGRFSGKAYNHTTKALCALPEGYVYKALEGQGDLIWEVVAE